MCVQSNEVEEAGNPIAYELQNSRASSEISDEDFEEGDVIVPEEDDMTPVITLRNCKWENVDM
ncbi:hypothetical protein ANCCEY_14035 [Ancylostoma ceylanicum]|uniref:Uncharacterized protein n=1 Tax=Ancylostoma ceylanicum TaxID=53326 RepID=A0A0D6LGV5_9BILA|nr:hypothetical protein ANCCEY_14035 [Ancylostoma ceylanicum]